LNKLILKIFFKIFIQNNIISVFFLKKLSFLCSCLAILLFIRKESQMYIKNDNPLINAKSLN